MRSILAYLRRESIRRQLRNAQALLDRLPEEIEILRLRETVETLVIATEAKRAALRGDDVGAEFLRRRSER